MPFICQKIRLVTPHNYASVTSIVRDVNTVKVKEELSNPSRHRDAERLLRKNRCGLRA